MKSNFNTNKQTNKSGLSIRMLDRTKDSAPLSNLNSCPPPSKKKEYIYLSGSKFLTRRRQPRKKKRESRRRSVDVSTADFTPSSSLFFLSNIYPNRSSFPLLTRENFSLVRIYTHQREATKRERERHTPLLVPR